MKVKVTKGFLENQLRSTEQLNSLLDRLQKKSKLREYLSKRAAIIRTHIKEENHIYDFDLPV